MDIILLIPLALLVATIVIVVAVVGSTFRVRRLTQEIELLRRRIERLEFDASRRTSPETETPLQPHLQPEPAPQPQAQPLPRPQPAAPPPLPPQWKAEAQPVTSPAPSRPMGGSERGAWNWERFMGVKLFAWVGGLALFLAAAFFVRYSFEQGWVRPELRVAAAWLLGIGLLTGGVVLNRRKTYQVAAHSFCGTGVVILYAASFTAHAYYRLIGSGVAFALMVGITAVAFLLAVRMPAIVVAVLGLLGGFLTPPLLSTHVDHPVGLFGYVAFLNVGLCAVVLWRRWNFLVPLAVAGTVFTTLGWIQKFGHADRAVPVLGIFAGFGLLFLLAFLVAKRLDRADHWIAASAAALPFIIVASVFFWISTGTLAHRPAVLLGFLLGADLALWIVALQYRALRSFHLVAGSAIFIVLSGWIVMHLDLGLLHWALAAIVGFALLHTVLPAALLREGAGDGAAKSTLAGKISAAYRSLLPFLLLTLVVPRVALSEPSLLFGIAFVVVVLLLVTARVTAVDLLIPVALAGVLGVEHTWHGIRYTVSNGPVALGWTLGFVLFFVVFPFAFRREFATRVVPWATAAMAGPLHFFLAYRQVRLTWPAMDDYLGLLPALFAMPMVGAFAVVRRVLSPGLEEAMRLRLLAWFGGSALFFITLIVPVQLEKEWITVGWALEGTALLWLFRRVPHPGLRGVGIALLITAFVRLTFNPEVFSYHPRGGTPILNWFLYGHGIVIACLLVGARLLAPPRNVVLETNVPPILNSMAAILAFLLLNIEIADFYSEGRTVAFQLNASFAQDMTYSIAWGLFALGILAIGFKTEARHARIAGMGLLVVTLLKLFLHDLWRLGGLYRVGALVGLAIVLIVVSLVYQRFYGNAARSRRT